MGVLLKQLQPGFVLLIRRSRIHPNDREDAVQEVLMRVMTCVSKYEPAQGDFENYVNSSVRTALMNIHARNGRQHVHESAGVDAVKGMSLIGWDHTTITDRTRAVEPQRSDVDELEILPLAHRDIVRDFYGIGLQRSFSINQIAARRKLPNAKVKAVLAEAKQRMKGVSV